MINADADSAPNKDCLNTCFCFVNHRVTMCNMTSDVTNSAPQQAA